MLTAPTSTLVGLTRDLLSRAEKALREGEREDLALAVLVANELLAMSEQPKDDSLKQLVAEARAEIVKADQEISASLEGIEKRIAAARAEAIGEADKNVEPRVMQLLKKARVGPGADLRLMLGRLIREEIAEALLRKQIAPGDGLASGMLATIHKGKMPDRVARGLGLTKATPRIAATHFAIKETLKSPDLKSDERKLLMRAITKGGGLTVSTIELEKIRRRLRDRRRAARA